MERATNNTENIVIRRSDIFRANFGEAKNSFQAGVRPAIIVSNELCNQYSPVITVVPVTSVMTKSNLKTHVLLSKDSGLEKDSIALCEQSTRFDRNMLICKIGECSDFEMKQINRAIQIQHGIDEPFDVNRAKRLISAILETKNNNLYEGLNGVKSVLVDEFKWYCNQYGYNYNDIYNKYKISYKESYTSRKLVAIPC